MSCAKWMQVVSTGDGDPITLLSVSLDGAILAVQRGSAVLQFIHLQSNKMFVQVLISHQEAYHVTCAHHVLAVEPALTAAAFLDGLLNKI